MKSRHTDERKPRHLLQRSRQRADERDHHADNAKDNRACPVARDRVHRNGKSQQVTRHDENEEEDPASTDELAAPFPSNDFAGVCHGGDLRELALHLAHDEACV